jgi:hypothetical protein
MHTTERSSHTASSASTHDSDDAAGVFSSTDSSSRTSRDEDRDSRRRKEGGRKILFKGKWCAPCPHPSWFSLRMPKHAAIILGLAGLGHERYTCDSAR